MQRDSQETNLERTLLIKQAAELLGVSRRTIYYRIREGRLRTIRTRCHSQRVLLSSIFELLREMRRAKEAQRGHRRTSTTVGADRTVTVQDAGA
jgi:excisionase family DNA binding protein